MDAAPSPRTPANPTPQSSGFSVFDFRFPPSAFLFRYFSSGWAFLIPYLLAYLVYYRLKWPVSISTSHVPPLLHIYWGLYVLNLLLAVFAILAWWSEIPASRVSAFRFSLSAFLPWFLLALVFFIPGTYLEFPADPWEHLARITHWADQNTLQTLYKSFGYSIPCSLLGRSHGESKLFKLDIYYTGTCLLLCWQYFRLGLAVRLSRRSAFIFVLLQTLLFGNSIFSFYRYYGIASTVYSQIGAIALTRIGLEAADGEAGLTFGRILGLLLSAVCLLLLIALNHVQGLGIAALGITAVAIWRMVKWKPSAIWWIGIATLLLSISAILWWPRAPAIDGAYRPFGVLTPWYGFNFFSSPPVTGNRTMQILGLFGVINLVAGILLVCRNHVVGWLTIMPVLALSLPFVAIPFSGALAQGGDWGNIITFHRMFFSMPLGLAVIVLINCILSIFSTNGTAITPHTSCPVPYTIAVLALLGSMVVPVEGPFYNRLWNALVKPPDDLSMRAVVNNFCDYAHTASYHSNSVYASTSGLGFVIYANENVPLLRSVRTYYSYGIAPAYDIELLKDALLQHRASGDAVTIVPRATVLCNAYSFAALSSKHWLPQEAAIAFAGAAELSAASINLGMQSSKLGEAISCYSKKK